jgi:hypothetical protein
MPDEICTTFLCPIRPDTIDDESFFLLRISFIRSPASNGTAEMRPVKLPLGMGDYNTGARSLFKIGFKAMFRG